MSAISILKLIEITNRIPLFKGLEAKDKERVVSIPQLVKVVKTGERFITFGEYDESFYILLSGKASVVQKNIKIAEIEGGQFVGEVGFICGEARTANVIAETNLITFKINKERFDKLPIALRDKIKDKLIMGLVNRVETMNAVISQLQNKVSDLQPEIEPEKTEAEDHSNTLDTNESVDNEVQEDKPSIKNKGNDKKSPWFDKQSNKRL